MTGLTVEGGRVTGVRYEQDGQEHVQAADVVISSMPVKDLVLGIPGAPEDMRRIAAGLPYRDFVTVGLLVPRLELKNETEMKTLGNIVPDCWIYVQDAHVRLGRIQIFNNWSPYMVKDPEHTVWIGLEYFCAEGDKYWNMSEAEWIDMAKRELVSMGVLSGADAVLDAHQERVKKAYPAYFDTYDEMDKLRAYLDGFANLYCVGRNGQHRYNNMDHSMVTAFEAVRNIREGIEDKSNHLERKHRAELSRNQGSKVGERMRELLSLLRRRDVQGLFRRPTTNAMVQFFRYAFVGGFAALVDWAVVWLVERLGAHYQVGVVCGFFAGLTVNYLLSKWLVFQVEKARTGAGGEFLGYALIGAVGLLLTMGLVHALTEWAGLFFMLSKIIATLIVLVWNFVARKLLLYRKAPQ